MDVHTKDFVLPSGLRVLVQAEHTQPIVGVTMVIDHGSASDPVGKEGLAHLVEHLAFRARHGDLPSVWDLLSQLGCSRNASTSLDYTDYRTACPAEALPQLLRLESLRLTQPLAGVTVKDFEIEREVVRNELRFRAENGFQAILPYTYGALYPDDHVYGRSTIGSHESLDALTLDDALAFVKTHYRAQDSTIAIVGDVDLDRSSQLIVDYVDLALWHPDLTEERMGRFPAPGVEEPDPEVASDWIFWPLDPEKNEPIALGKPIRRVQGPSQAPPDPDTTDVMRFEAAVEHPSLVLAWTLPGAYRENSRTLKLVSPGMNALIRGQMKRDSHGALAGQNASYGCGVYEGVHSTQLICSIIPAATVDREKLAKQILAKLGDAGGSYIDDQLAQLNALGSNDAIRDAMMELERVGDISDGRATRLAHFAHFEGGTDITMAAINSVLNYDSGQTIEIAKAWVRRDRAVTILLDPIPDNERLLGSGGGGYHGNGEGWSLDMALDPARITAEAITSYATVPDVDQIEDVTLANGLRIVAMEHGSIPFVRMTLFFEGGAASGDPAMARLAQSWLVSQKKDEDLVVGDWRWRTRSSGRLQTLVGADNNVKGGLWLLRKAFDQPSVAVSRQATGSRTES